MNKKKSKFSKNISQNFFLNVIFTSSNHPATQTKTIFCPKIEKIHQKRAIKNPTLQNGRPVIFQVTKKVSHFFFDFSTIPNKPTIK